MQNFDLNLLRLALAIDGERTVSGAARRLGISQPAASAALARLREVLDDRIFVKTARGMEPTPRAIRLIAAAREILARVDREILAKASFVPESSSDTFTFALSDIGEMVFLPKLVEYFSVHAPNALIRSVTRSPQRLEQELESGEIDLAIGYYPDIRRSGFVQQRLMTHHFTCLMRADHPAAAEPLTVPRFLALRHALVSAEGRSQEIFERFLADHKLDLNIVLRTPHFMTIPMIVAQSDLVVIVPHALGLYFVRESGRYRLIDPPLEIPRIELRQHWHEKFNKDPKVVWLREVVSTLFNDKSDEWRQ